MLPYAANALLKTLEEPSEDSFILLTTSKPDALLPTITSRLHPIRIASTSYPPIDLSKYFAMAQKGNWPQLLQELPVICEEEPEPLLQAFLTFAAEKNQFLRFSTLIETAQKALLHNVKLRTIALHLFLHI